MKYILIVFVLLSNIIAAEKTTGSINKINAGTINTLLIFTSQEGLNSGTYKFTNTPIDINMEIYHLPFTYNFSSDSNLNYFLVGNVGYSRVFIDGSEGNIPPTSDLNYLNHIRTYTAGIGGGVCYKLQDIALSGGMEFIYSNAGISIKDEGGPVSDFFNENYTDNITYKFFTLLEYRPIINEFKPYATLAYKLYETKSDFSTNDIVSFTSESSVTTLSLGIESPKLYSFGAQNITLEGYINVNYLSGVVSEVVNFDLYRSIGGVIYYNTPKSPWWASRFFIEGNDVRSNGLNGYNFGIGFTIDF